MHSRLSRLIAEISIVFVSIFVTIGLLIGASTNEIKTTYIFLGYMLYYSLPFILACCFSIVSLLSEEVYSAGSEAAALLGNTFFITGLAMIMFLAGLGAQTSLLPAGFTYLAPYSSVPYIEFLVFVVVLATVAIGSQRVIPNSRRLRNNRKWLFSVFSVLFIVGIVFMLMFGVRQIGQAFESNLVILDGLPNYPLRSINITLETMDQIMVKTNSSESQYFSYVFVDFPNYELYQNYSTRLSAKVMEYDNYRLSSSFTAVIEASGIYYLVMKSENFLGSNVTYSIEVSRPDNSLLVFLFFGSTFSLSVIIATVSARVDECSYIV